MCSIDFSVLDEVKPGDKITVRFTEHAIQNLNEVLLMESMGVLLIGNSDFRFFYAVREAGEWTGSLFRTFTAGSSWNKDFFVRHAQKTISWIEVTPGEPTAPPMTVAV